MDTKHMLSINQYYQFTQLAAISPNKFSSVLGANQRDSPNRFMQLTAQDILSVSRDPRGSKFIQEQLQKSDYRGRIFGVILDNKALIALAKDQSGNFVIQKMIDHQPTSELEVRYQRRLVAELLVEVVDLSCNRFSCRVVQKLVERGPKWCVTGVMNQFASREVQISNDPNANHIIQCVFKVHPPSMYNRFVCAFVVEETKFREVIQNRYGCRVIQVCLESLVKYCKSSDPQNKEEINVAYELLHVLVPPILCNAIPFSEDQYANYIVQYLIGEEYMERQRKYIIKTCILQNILWLSQSKYASHVVEQALIHADPPSLCAMFNEVLNGYEPDHRGRNALDIMLFDQFGNYVVQRLLTIAIDVYNGNKKGDPSWLVRIGNQVYKNERALDRYSSGKKILDMLHGVMPLSFAQPPPPLPIDNPTMGVAPHPIPPATGVASGAANPFPSSFYYCRI